MNTKSTVGLTASAVSSLLNILSSDFGIVGPTGAITLTADQMTRWLEKRESDRRADDDRTAAKVLSLGSARATALGPSA